MNVTPGQATSVFAEPTNCAHGLTRDLQGRLPVCEHDSPRVTRQEADGNITAFANSFQGRPLNRPNDVIVKSGARSTSPKEQSARTRTMGSHLVYRLSPNLGTRTLLLDDMEFSKGLASSPEESVLHINGHIRARRASSAAI